MTPAAQLAHEINARRVAAGMSIEALRKKAKVSVGTASNTVNGATVPNPRQLIAIASALSVSDRDTQRWLELRAEATRTGMPPLHKGRSWGEKLGKCLRDARNKAGIEWKDMDDARDTLRHETGQTIPRVHTLVRYAERYGAVASLPEWLSHRKLAVAAMLAKKTGVSVDPDADMAMVRVSKEKVKCKECGHHVFAHVINQQGVCLACL